MALDLEAIRRRVQELSGVRKNSSVQMWKPGIGEHKVRCLPWKDAPEGQPFMERWFYYIGDGPGILTPHQFNKPDPINDLIRKLYQSGKPEDRAMAKQLQPKMRVYAPVIVRGQEDQGILVWAFGKQVYQRLLGFFIDEETGDILDPLSGYDLKVTLSQAAGKQWKDTVVDAARKPSKLHEDPAQMKTLLESVPNIDDMYRLKSVQEIENALNAWLNAGAPVDNKSDGTLKGTAPTDELDKLASEVKGTTETQKTVVAEKAVAKKVVAKKPALDDLDDEKPAKKQSLDDAFKDLMADE